LLSLSQPVCPLIVRALCARRGGFDGLGRTFGSEFVDRNKVDLDAISGNMLLTRLNQWASSIREAVTGPSLASRCADSSRAP
jgi:hypothetical protein